MPAEPALSDTQQLELPQDLVSALNNRVQKPRTDFRIEALKPSLFGRLVEKLIGGGK